jgi:hypothetical protein
MGQPNRATQGKRNREKAKQEKQAEKREDRARRKEVRESRALQSNGGEDPDIAGIVPGPQPIQED